MITDTPFKAYQEDAIQAAEELMYGDKVIERLKKQKPKPIFAELWQQLVMKN